MSDAKRFYGVGEVFALRGKRYVVREAPGSEADCGGCAFYRHTMLCHQAPDCERRGRSDGKSVIFVKAESEVRR